MLQSSAHWLTAVTKPKGLLFFSALLPQFIDPQRSLPLQFAVIAATYAFTEFVTEFVLASAARRVRPGLARTGRRFNPVCAGISVLIGAAVEGLSRASEGRSGGGPSARSGRPVAEPRPLRPPA